MEYTYLNWPTITFFLIFLLCVLIERGRYIVEIKPREGKITTYSLYRLFSKEIKFNDITEASFYPNYVALNFNADSCYLYLNQKNLNNIKKVLKKQDIKIDEIKTKNIFNQFFI